MVACGRTAAMSTLQRFSTPIADFTRRRRVELLVLATVWGSCAYFFQGGGWNQNAHFATTVALVDDGTFFLDDYRHSTGDLARAGDHVASAKPVATALVMVPGYVISGPLTAAIDNRGNRIIARAYITTVLSTGLALALFAVVAFVLMRRRIGSRDAAVMAVAMALATPLFPNSIMTNSAPWPALLGLAAYAVLEAHSVGGPPLDPRRLIVAGLLAGLAATFEYMTAVIVVPLGIYALWQCRRRHEVLFFAAGVLVAALIPLLHHTAVYGNPFHVGYASLLSPGFARDANRGWMGFRDFSLLRLYDLTFGGKRGYFFLSPFLVAAVPGVARLIRERATRPEGIALGATAGIILCLVASLVYWHSGWSLSSRYALLFVAFSAVPVAVMVPRYRVWILVGVAIGFVSMLLAVMVTASPPPPGSRAPRMTVTGWLWFRFLEGDIPRNAQPVLRMLGHDTGNPTWRSAFNLGTAAGLPGYASVAPYLIYVASMLRAVWRWTTKEVKSNRGCGRPPPRSVDQGVGPV